MYQKSYERSVAALVFHLTRWLVSANIITSYILLRVVLQPLQIYYSAPRFFTHCIQQKGNDYNEDDDS